MSLPNISGPTAGTPVDTPQAEEPGAEASSSPALPIQSTHDPPAPPSSQGESGTGGNSPGWWSPVEAAGVRPPAEDPGATFASKHLEPNHRSSLCSGLQTHSGSPLDPLPGGPSGEPSSWGQLPAREASLSLFGGEQPFPSPAKGGGARECGGGWPSAGGRQPGSVPCTCPGGEAFVELEVVEETLVVATQQEAQLPGASLGGSPMEVDWSRQDSACSADLLPGGGLMQPGSSPFGVPGASASASLSRPSLDQLSSLAEEPCPSLTSALKELHRLLVESCKADSQEDSGCQPAGVPKEPVASQGAAEETHEHPEGEHPCPDSTAGKALAGVHVLEAAVESLGVQGGPQLAAGAWQECLAPEAALNGPDVHSLLAAASQLQSSELPDVSSPHWSSSQGPDPTRLGQIQPPPSIPQVEEASRSAGGSSPAGAGMPGVQGSLAEPSQPLPVGSADTGPQPPAFPAADIDRIVGSGFTPQEAGEALVQAGGNADLALLVLLAKNIVVPR